MAIAVSVRPTLSDIEIDEAISLLSDADWLRLRKTARFYGRGVLNPEDLLHEAFLSALEGRRRCPRDVDVVRFLVGAIRSLASSCFKSAARHPELHVVEPIERDDESTDTSTDCDLANIEQAMISGQETEKIINTVLALFQDDEIAQIIVEGDMEGMCFDELYELTGLNKTEFASKRRLIRRRIDRAFPEGWKL